MVARWTTNKDLRIHLSKNHNLGECTSFAAAAEVAIGEVEVLEPVEVRERVLAGADVIADRSAD